MGPLSAQSLETELSVEEQDLMSQAQDDKYVSKYSDWRLIALDFKHLGPALRKLLYNPLFLITGNQKQHPVMLQPLTSPQELGPSAPTVACVPAVWFKGLAALWALLETEDCNFLSPALCSLPCALCSLWCVTLWSSLDTSSMLQPFLLLHYHCWCSAPLSQLSVSGTAYSTKMQVKSRNGRGT